MGLFGGVKKLKIKQALQTAKEALCSYFKLTDQSICKINYDKKDKSMGYVQAKYGDKSYFRIFFCNPTKKGELPFMSFYYAVCGQKADSKKLADFNTSTDFVCVNAPYVNEIQFIHVTQLITNDHVADEVTSAFTALFTEQKIKKCKAVSASVDL
jgi:hypothetical protein